MNIASPSQADRKDRNEHLRIVGGLINTLKHGKLSFIRQRPEMAYQNFMSEPTFTFYHLPNALRARPGIVLLYSHSWLKDPKDLPSSMSALANGLCLCRILVVSRTERFVIRYY